MNRRKPITARQLAREKLLFRYSSALERGDFDTLAAILREAEADPVLEKMLAEIDAVYRAELAPLPVLPTLSTNHNHRHTREDEPMNVTYPTISRRLPDTRSRGRWNSTATLAAAMIALALFAAVLISRRPPTEPQQGNPGIAMQNETATPIPSITPTLDSQQMFPTITATPAGGVIIEIGTLPPGSVQFIPSMVPNTLVSGFCTGTVYMAEGVNLLSQPNINGIVIGRIPASTAVEVLIQQVEVDVATNQEWYFVQAQNAEQAALGWMPASMVTETSPCQNVSDPCNVTPAVVAIEATPTWTPTPATGSQVEPLDVTATPNLMPTFVPTVPPPPCVSVPTLSITPTAGIPYGAWNSAMLRETVNGIPANTPVRIVGAFFDGQIWLYAIETLDDSMNAYAPESALIIYAPMDATPIAVFDMALRDGGYVLLTTEQVGDIPANALVRINSAQYNGSEWLYEVIAKDGQTRGEAYDWQLKFATDYIPGAVTTPTAVFNSALGSGIYAAVTNQAVGNIPAGTEVQLNSAFYNGIEWNYNITDASGRDNTARESQLDFAPGYTPGMATPTAAYFDLRGQVLITLVQVGPIPPNTPVQATSGYYDGNEWVYGIVTLDSTAFADARASQLRVVSLDEAGVPPSPIPPTFPPTAPPTLTPTPFS